MDVRLRSGPEDALAIRRVHPHEAISGTVVVEAGKRLFLLQAVKLSARGAKVRPTERVGEGTLARLHFHPPDGSSLDVEAIVWRVDLDGLAFCFTEDNDRWVTTRLVQLAGASLDFGRSSC
jgi:PilZ domain